MPSYVTGDTFTILAADSGRGLRSPKRHDLTVRTFSRKSLAALASSFIDSRYSIRSMPEYKHEALTTASPLRTRQVYGHDLGCAGESDPMKWKQEIGRRLQSARVAKLRPDGKKWSLEDLSKATDGLLSKSRISNYEQGVREPGPREASILADVLGVSAAWLLCLEDDMDKEETEFFRNWKALPENERRGFARRIAALALAYMEPLPDEKLQHIPKTPKIKARKSAKS